MAKKKAMNGLRPTSTNVKNVAKNINMTGNSVCRAREDLIYISAAGTAIS